MLLRATTSTSRPSWKYGKNSSLAKPGPWKAPATSLALKSDPEPDSLPVCSHY